MPDPSLEEEPSQSQDPDIFDIRTLTQLDRIQAYRWWEHIDIIRARLMDEIPGPSHTHKSATAGLTIDPSLQRLDNLYRGMDGSEEFLARYRQTFNDKQFTAKESFDFLENICHKLDGVRSYFDVNRLHELRDWEPSGDIRVAAFSPLGTMVSGEIFRLILAARYHARAFSKVFPLPSGQRRSKTPGDQTKYCERDLQLEDVVTRRRVIEGLATGFALLSLENGRSPALSLVVFTQHYLLKRSSVKQVGLLLDYGYFPEILQLARELEEQMAEYESVFIAKIKSLPEPA